MSSLKNIIQLIKDAGLQCEVDKSLSNTFVDVIGWDSFQGGPYLTFFKWNKLEELQKYEGKKSGCILIKLEMKGRLKPGPFLYVEDPQLAFIYASKIFYPDSKSSGIHPSTIIDSDANIGDIATIGANCIIGKCNIGVNVHIGHAVIIEDGTDIGDNCTILSGANIGAMDLSSETNVQNEQVIFPQLGKVIIGNDVMIGVNTIVNRGALSDTIIGRNTHIGGQCYIGHNCRLGDHVYVAPCAVLAGSVVISERCFLGVRCCIRDYVKIAPRVTIGMNVEVRKSIIKEGITKASKNIPLELPPSIFSLKRER